jgi:surface protein
MKKLLLLIISLVSINQTIAQAVVLDNNGVTIKWTGTTVPSPYFIQASPRGTLEWFAIVDNTTKSKITDYAKNVQSGIDYFTPTGESTPIPFDNIVTSLVIEMNNIFSNTAFNEPIGSWDVSNVTTMGGMFVNATSFNQPISSWNVTNVTNMMRMFANTPFNEPIDSWDVSNVINMNSMFSQASSFNKDIDSWNVSSVTNMGDMFNGAKAFNQPIGSWDVSSVTDMRGMFANAHRFNQDIGNWNVSNVIIMYNMFSLTQDFNQNIGNWNVTNVTNMDYMFNETVNFNQDISNWNVSNVTTMESMFNRSQSFNQNIGNWNVSNVVNMKRMFDISINFDQDISSWDVSNVNRMDGMFAGSKFNQDISSWDVSSVTSMESMFSGSSFNQSIGPWDVSNVTNMSAMFSGATLSTANYDATLIGWASKTLKPNVTFSGGNSTYCNSANARGSIINTYGWTITDGGLDCSSLNTEEFDIIGLKLYPNPVKDKLFIQGLSGPAKVSIYNLLGTLVLSKIISSEIDVENLQIGIYIMKINSEQKEIIRKFIKN